MTKKPSFPRRKAHLRLRHLLVLLLQGGLALVLFGKLIFPRSWPPVHSHSSRAFSTLGEAHDVHRVLFVVITGEAYHPTRLRTLLDTWGRWVPAQNLLIVSDKADSSLGTVEAPGTAAGYEASQAKWYFATLMAAERLRSRPTIDWVCVADDDTFLFVPNLLRLLATLNKTKRAYYGEVCSPTDCGGPCVCGGGGWVAPSSLFMEMATAFSNHGSWPPPCCTSTIFSDLIISQWMNEVAQVPLIFRKEFRSYPPDFYLRPELSDPLLHPDRNRSHMRLGTQGWGNVVSFHYVGTGRYGTSAAIDERLLYSLSRAFFGDTKENKEYRHYLWV